MKEYFEIQADYIEVEGVRRELPLDLKEVPELFGLPNRVMHRTNIIHTWDDNGFHIYSKKNGLFINSLDFSFVSEKFDFAPANNFQGRVLIENVKIDQNTTEQGLLNLGFSQTEFGKNSVTKKIFNRSVYVSFCEKTEVIDGLSLTLTS